MFGLRKVSAATSALLLPWVISARISDFPVGQALAAARPVEPAGAAGPRRRVADDDLAGVHGLQRGDQVAGRQRLRQVAVHALPRALSTRSGWKFQV